MFSVLNNIFKGSSSGIIDESFFGNSGFSWEKNEFADISKKSSFIEVKRFLAFVSSSVVNRDSNASGKINSESSFFNFLK